MDLIAFLKENDMLLFFLFTSFFALLFIKLTFSKTIKNLPPSPPTLPIIGNLHQIGDKPHISITNFAKEYGPLMSLRLGSQLLVVASSPETAMEILKFQDRSFSSRFVPSTFRQSSILPYSLIWSDCDQTWRTLRTVCRTELFSPKAMETHSRVREEKISDMLEFLRNKQGEVVDIGELVFTTLFNTLSCIIFGQDFIDLKDEHETHGGLKDSLENILEYGGKPDFGDFFPMFQRLDLQGIKKGGLKQIKIVFSFWEHMIKERRSQIGSSAWSSDQANTLLDRLIEQGFSDVQINQLATELYVAGTDTTTSTVGWAIAELLKHKEALSKVESEVMKKEMNFDKITESQLSELPYLHACIKETLRIHPTGPFLLPHRAQETCEVMGYTVPKDAQVFVNIWAISRDPKIWDDPLSFKPERFLGSKVDFRGQNFEFTPFGAGRRMCPGLPLGVKSVELILASLIRGFDWVLPNGDDPSQLDMNDKFGVTLQKEKPMKIIFKPKQQSLVA
ncbi:probable (S)-N-methylcoclaurine 3'-hydroxylase isozyme 2 [Cynara cardunculus var. scolymus]|uniref:Cytochrome P450 n=1 Tax=Cynara cardunculus var. scolymus TaxID=59895 RepID=A0A124SFY7_CYNCS|nr:probable (S)-N-methylcoclaurine 3'-hydroxylase isozyme 2 [Cynara cardunculus var. scolymus]KVI04742.1 cytochrome P450 [Cynara cardunculus var. scolymus]